MILAIDQSIASTGLCLAIGDKMITKLVITSPEMTWLHRMAKIVEEVCNFFMQGMSMPARDVNVPPMIVMEDYAFAGSSKGFILGELGGILKFHLYQRFGMVVPQITAAHHKMYIARNGHATKKDTMKALKERFGIECASDDLADAMSMAMLTRDMLKYEAKKLVPTKYDKVIFDRVRRHFNGELSPDTIKRREKAAAKRVATRRARKSAAGPAPSLPIDPFATDSGSPKE